jgi:hypothetical protein
VERARDADLVERAELDVLELEVCARLAIRYRLSFLTTAHCLIPPLFFDDHPLSNTASLF